MDYNPFDRGQAPVGVRTFKTSDPSRGNREITVEVWYPAREVHAGQDINPQTRDRYTVAPGLPTEAQRAIRHAYPAKGSFPLVLFFHGAFGHRRGASGLCTHLASHGYLVVAPDFSGNTISDQMHDITLSGEAPWSVTSEQSARDRPLDAILVMDFVQSGLDRDLSAILDADRVGSCGISFGGWTCLAVNAKDKRPRASVPIVPAWGKGPVATEDLSDPALLKEWGRPVPTLVLAAERDAMVMLDSLRELHRDLPAPKRFVSLKNAGHVHFNDNAEQRHESVRTMLLSNAFPGGDRFDLKALATACRPFSELCPAWHGEETVRALCLAQMDAHLKENAGARIFLGDELPASFWARGIEIEAA